MLVRLVDLFSFLSVVLRAGTLVFQSVLLGGVLFVLWTARSSPAASEESIARVRASSWKLLRLSAVGLAIMQLLYLYLDSAVLMASAEGSIESLYPFLYSGSTDVSAVLEQVRQSTVAKADEILQLRRLVRENCDYLARLPSGQVNMDAPPPRTAGDARRSGAADAGAQAH